MSGQSNPSSNRFLTDTVRERVETLDESVCRDWGGVCTSNECRVSRYEDVSQPPDRTVVRSPAEGVEAFAEYEPWFEYVLRDFEESHDAVTLVPCGAEKPIGSSQFHQKMLDGLRDAGITARSDVMIVSEPCTVIPHEDRLALPAVNYDFPPEYAEEDVAPEVFEVFTDRLARWIDASEYETVYAYLVSRHQRKLEVALQKASRSPDVVWVPAASANVSRLREYGDAAYSGDLFKTVEDVEAKLRFACRFLAGDRSVDVSQYDESVVEFYREKFCDTP